MNIKKGDTVFIKAQRGAYEATVISVDNKYITIDDGRKFNAMSGLGEFGYALYESKEAYENEFRAFEETRKLRKEMEFMKFTLAQIEAIRKIIH